VELSFRRPSPPNSYSYVQDKKLDSTREFVEIYLLFTCLANLILMLDTQSRDGLEEPL
jgi:hypothetical protein